MEVINKRKKKLAVFHPVIAPYRVDFFNALNNSYYMDFYMFRSNLNSQKFKYENITRQLNFTPKILNKYYNFLFFKLRKGIISAIKKSNPDVVFVSECGIEAIIIIIYKLLFHKRYKIISIIDDSYDMLNNNNQISLKHSYAEKLVIPHCNNIINVEPKVVAYFKKKYNKGIYFPIIRDENKLRGIYNKVLPISEEYIKTYNLHDKKVLLFVGRLVKIKNVSFAINVINKLKFDNLCLVIVGEGDYEKELKLQANGNPNIIFTGRLEGDALYAWYNIAEFFILPSTLEPFGAVTNEALIAGCFCFISEKAGSNCLIKDGFNGFVFNPNDEDHFMDLLKKSLSNVMLRTYPLDLKKSNMIYDFSIFINDLISEIDKS